MKQKIQISIPKPCHEGWQNMTPVNKGRFCASCQKTVLDFSNLSDNEIINLVSKNDNLCGRISTSQLNRDLIETKRTSNYFGYFATSVLAFLGLSANNVVAQEKPVQEQTDNKYQYKPTDTISEITVSGTVKDEKGELMPGATIVIKSTDKGVMTDIDGKYSIKSKLGDVLEFSYLDRVTISVTVSSNIINVQFDKPIELIEGFVITTPVKKQTYIGRKLRKIRNWFR